MKTFSSILLVGLLVFGSGHASLRAAQDGNRGQFSLPDFKFASGAIRGSMIEVKGGEIANIQAEEPLVQQFAQMMVAVHARAVEELRALAATNLATLPPELTSKDLRSVVRLQKLEGAAFDRAYINGMVEDHKRAVKEFSKAAREADDPDLRAFAARYVSTWNSHLEHARQLQDILRSQTAQTE